MMHPGPPAYAGGPAEGAGSCVLPPRRIALRTLLVMLNPLAGKGKALRALDVILPIFEGAGIRAEVFRTQAAGDVRRMAQQRDLRSFDAVCVLGGDGTIAEALGGLMARADGFKLPIAIVPCGTGNSFAADFGRNRATPEQSARSIVQGNVRQADSAWMELGPVSGVHFMNMVDWPADYVKRAESMRWMGPARYNVAATMEIMGGRLGRHVRMIIDEEVIETFVMIIHVQNNKFCGDEMLAAPAARIDDGLLDMFFIPKLGKAALLGLLKKVQKGGHMSDPRVVWRRFSKLRVEPLGGAPQAVNVDGDSVGTDPLLISVLPRAWEFII